VTLIIDPDKSPLAVSAAHECKQLLAELRLLGTTLTIDGSRIRIRIDDEKPCLPIEQRVRAVFETSTLSTIIGTPRDLRELPHGCWGFPGAYQAAVTQSVARNIEEAYRRRDNNSGGTI